jgi:hypothetical protein
VQCNRSSIRAHRSGGGGGLYLMLRSTRAVWAQPGRPREPRRLRSAATRDATSRLHSMETPQRQHRASQRTPITVASECVAAAVDAVVTMVPSLQFMLRLHTHRLTFALTAP